MNNPKTAKKPQNHINFSQKSLKFAIHPVTIALLVLSIFANMFWLVFAYFVSLIYHEFAHALVANKLGYKCQKIVVYPTGALLSGAYDEFSFKDEIIVSLAGPFANLVLCVVLIFIWWIFPEAYNYTSSLVLANLSLFLFNLLPIFPLDGGRVLLAALSTKTSRINAIKISKYVTIIFSILLFCYFLISLFFEPNFQIGITAIVVFISSFSDSKELSYKRIIKTDIKKKKTKRGLKGVTLVFNQQVMLSKVAFKIDNFAYYFIKVVDDNMLFVAEFCEKEFEEICKNYPLNYTLKDIISIKK